MLSVNIICVGKLKESYLRDACDEYVKRLGAFCKVKIIELPETKLSDNPSDKEINACLESEGSKILEYMTQKLTYNFAMCIEGSQVSSVELSEKLNDVAVRSFSAVNFIIGSSYGLSDRVKKASDFKLSMSKMTFPHQLARVMLLEQTYRAFMIQNNGKYHK